MKFIANKKIAFSVMSLIAALALAVATVYAWFVIRKTVDTSGIDSQITSGDVLSFEIDYYFTTSENGADFEIGDQIDPESDDIQKSQMHDYTPRISDNAGTATAVLMDMKITFAKSGTFEMSANINHSDVYDSDDFEKFTEENYLSNVIFMRNITTNNMQFTQKKFSVETNAYSYNFITDDAGDTVYFNGEDDESKKNTSVDLPDYTVSEGATGKDNVHHIYFVMDYMSAQINAMYPIMLRLFPADANLNTRIDFLHDIVFNIGRSAD